MLLFCIDKNVVPFSKAYAQALYGRCAERIVAWMSADAGA
jgi:hypothetical protein